MPTLTERLRLGTNMHDRACHLAMHEAADEIERLKAGIGSARSCLEQCFEPTVPLRVIQSELERAVKDAYIALRRTLSN